MVTEGKWEKEGNRITVSGSGVIAICPSPTTSDGIMEFIANTKLIVSAVNACKSVNQDNPQAVAESIKEMYEALGTIKRTAESSGDLYYLQNALKTIARIVREIKAKADRRE